MVTVQEETLERMEGMENFTELGTWTLGPQVFADVSDCWSLDRNLDWGHSSFPAVFTSDYHFTVGSPKFFATESSIAHWESH